MKRDMDLARKILLNIEAHQSWDDYIEMKIDGYSDEEVEYHVLLLHEAGLIEAEKEVSIARTDWFPKRLTWQGHEFLDASRDEKRWKQAKDMMAKAGGFVLEVAKPLLVELMKAQITGTPT